jgi:hypothetical protein
VTVEVTVRPMARERLHNRRRSETRSFEALDLNWTRPNPSGWWWGIAQQMSFEHGRHFVDDEKA